MKLLLLAGLAALLGLGRGRRPTRTAWTNAGLPRPIADLPTLERHAAELAAALRARAPSAGLVRQLQRGAGLLREVVETAERSPDEGRDRAAEGTYDALTRQATGYYGRLWIEETP